MKALRAAIVALTATLAYAVPAQAGPQATIIGTFADACRDFTAHSTKDISNVVLHRADGRVVKDEAIAAPDYSIDGGVGDEIVTSVVKSGTTTKRFTCDQGSAPVAVLEIRLSPNCQPYTPPSTGEPFYWCHDGTNNSQRTVFVDPGDLNVQLGCLPADALCFAVTFRATNSTDPDGDIAGWSIAFDDGGIAEGGWAATPPDEVTHEYAAAWQACATAYCHITLTVTDSQGRTATDSVGLAFFDITPD